MFTRRTLSTKTADSTPSAPTSCSGPSSSPKTRNASSSVTGGSTVARIDAVVGPTRRRPAKKRLTAAKVQTTAMHADPAPAGGRQAVGVEVADQRGRRHECHRGAGAHERREQLRAEARHGALADEDVRRVDDSRAQPERDAERVERAGAGARDDKREAAEGQRQRGHLAAVELLAAERDRGDRDHRRERVEDERQQRRVDPLERGEEAARLERVADAAERESDADRRGARRRAARGASAARRARAPRTAPPPSGSARRAACRPSRRRRRRACRRSPSTRTRPRRRGRGRCRTSACRHRARSRHQDRFRFPMANR